METVIFHPTKRKLVIYRDGVEVPEQSAGLEEWRDVRTYGMIGGRGGAVKAYRCLEVQEGEARRASAR